MKWQMWSKTSTLWSESLWLWSDQGFLDLFADHTPDYPAYLLAGFTEVV